MSSSVRGKTATSANPVVQEVSTLGGNKLLPIWDIFPKLENSVLTTWAAKTYVLRWIWTFLLNFYSDYEDFDRSLSASWMLSKIGFIEHKGGSNWRRGLLNEASHAVKSYINFTTSYHLTFQNWSAPSALLTGEKLRPTGGFSNFSLMQVVCKPCFGNKSKVDLLVGKVTCWGVDTRGLILEAGI